MPNLPLAMKLNLGFLLASATFAVVSLPFSAFADAPAWRGVAAGFLALSIVSLCGFLTTAAAERWERR